jgi:hypothetical protein
MSKGKFYTHQVANSSQTVTPNLRKLQSVFMFRPGPSLSMPEHETVVAIHQQNELAKIKSS